MIDSEATMNVEKRKMLESLGWTAEMLDSLERTAHHESVDRMFEDRTEKALSAAGYSALNFLAANPRLSVVELAKRLNRGASAIGITKASYREAAGQGVVRDLAKNMLIREILFRFSDGWTSASNIHPLVTIGRWYSEIAEHAGEPRFGQYAEQIIRSLAIDNPPPEGWRPQYPSDPLIDELFRCHWPIDLPEPATRQEATT
jgi:hypothetical protein